MGNRIEDLVCVRAGQLQTLKPLLDAWTKAVLHYCKITNHLDNPWWFNERASLSTLAGAAWTLPNWAALEEFNTRKRGGILPRNKTGDGTRHGRCDLYISQRKGYSYAIEAKQAWQAIGDGQDGVSTFKMMQAAWDDVSKLDKKEADRRLAVTFVIPYLPRKIAKERNAREVVVDWLTSDPFAHRTRKTHAQAWVFPANSEEYFNEKTGRVFPGIVALVEERFRGSRRKAEP